MIKTVLLVVVTLFVIGGCSDNKERAVKGATADMKCGAGKCGANMFDGNSALIKKKENILSQMRENDSRRDCVIKAKTTKATYDCVRNAETGMMSLKCGGQEEDMKCGAGKCGGKM